MKVASLFWLLPAFVAAQSPTTATLSPWQTGEVTPDGTCGGDTGFVCSPIWGACCSKDGICGRSSKYCGEGCQPKAGNCNAAAPPPEKPLGPGSLSPDGSCGGTNKYVCGGSTFGDCCSLQGWCGNSTAHCGNDCLSDFGKCGPPSNITANGQCGSNGKICLGSGFGDCCSSTGWCGDKTDHCGAGCQTGFGNCTLTNAGDVSTDGFCGKNGKTCKGSTYGDCCSAEGYCGKDSHCGAGCQTAFGTCNADSGAMSTDGRCGSFNGKTCKGSTFGDCCSAGGWCGDKTEHCDSGCQAKFGSCNSEGSKISTDGRCGTFNGKVCKGSTYGDCCSAEGYCGRYNQCDAGCQSAFGDCKDSPSNISTDGSCGKNGKTCKGSKFGDCCSRDGKCGKGDDFCRDGCQISHGLCPGISSDSECGSRNGKTCAGSGLGNCCSSNGFCGTTYSHCGQGCQKGASSGCMTKNVASLDSTCGSKVGLTCAGGPFNGQCCGASGFCGTTSSHCGSGCQNGFGRCN